MPAVCQEVAFEPGLRTLGGCQRSLAAQEELDPYHKPLVRAMSESLAIVRRAYDVLNGARTTT